MALKGSGKKGHRLWVRAPDKRWIEIPYGAGQDAKVRSINFYRDGQWMTPAWADRERKLIHGDDNTPYHPGTLYADLIDAMDVRVPGVTWIGPYSTVGSSATTPYWNPNYLKDQVNARPYQQQYSGWTRLFHVTPRVDPTWRIVTLGRMIAAHVPNRTMYMGVPNDQLYFWPSINLTGLTITDGIVTDTKYSFGGDLPPSALASHFIYANDPDFAGTNPTNTDRNSISQQVGVIDLAAIRDRLEKDYEHQSEDFTGQYHSMKNMLLRRVIVHAYVTVNVTLTGTAHDINLNDLGDLQFTVRARANVPTTSRTEQNASWQTSATVQYADDTQSSTGRELLTLGFDDLITNAYYNSNNETTSVIGYYYAATDDDAINAVFEAPGENNIAFFAEVTGLPSLDDTIGFASANFNVLPVRIALHYADTNTDTPYNTQEWNVIG